MKSSMENGAHLEATQAVLLQLIGEALVQLASRPCFPTIDPGVQQAARIGH